MIKTIRYLAMFLLIFNMVSFSGRAQAEPKPWIWSWWESHWDHLDFIPYLENGTHPHNSQWDHQGWSSEQWEAQYQDNMEIVENLYRADIIRDQYIDDDILVMEVGSGFYMLGGQDKRRVTQTIDHIYGITTQQENGMFMLYDGETDKAIGSYTRYGLQIQ